MPRLVFTQVNNIISWVIFSSNAERHRNISYLESWLYGMVVEVTQAVECDIFSVKPVLTEINRDSVLETE